MEEFELEEPPPDNPSNFRSRMVKGPRKFWHRFVKGSYDIEQQTLLHEKTDNDSILFYHHPDNNASSVGCKKRTACKILQYWPSWFFLGFLVLAGLLIYIACISTLGFQSRLNVARTSQASKLQSALISTIPPLNTSKQASPSQQEQQGTGNQVLTLLGNYSMGIEKKGQMLSGQIGNVNLCDEPTIKRSFPNLDYSLKGYNYLKGFPISLEHDPGFSHQIFQVVKI